MEWRKQGRLAFNQTALPLAAPLITAPYMHTEIDYPLTTISTRSRSKPLTLYGIIENHIYITFPINSHIFITLVDIWFYLIIIILLATTILNKCN